MKKNILYVSLILSLVLMMTATTVFAAAGDSSLLLKGKKTAVPTGEVPTTELTPAPRGNSALHANQASNDTKVKKENFRGTVVSSTDTSLTIELKKGGEQVFTLDAETVIKYPTHFIPVVTEEPTAAPTVDPSATVVPEGPLAVGLEVMVRAAKQTDESYLAMNIMVIPGKPVKVHHVGVVSAYTAGESIEITTKDGSVDVFELSETTKYLPDGSVDTLKVGDTVTIIIPRVLTGQPLVAAGVVLHGDADTETEAPEAD